MNRQNAQEQGEDRDEGQDRLPYLFGLLKVQEAWCWDAQEYGRNQGRHGCNRSRTAIDARQPAREINLSCPEGLLSPGAATKAQVPLAARRTKSQNTECPRDTEQ